MRTAAAAAAAECRREVTEVMEVARHGQRSRIVACTVELRGHLQDPRDLHRVEVDVGCRKALVDEEVLVHPPGDTLHTTRR